MTEYRASMWHGPVESTVGPFAFFRTVFTDSTGHAVEKWSCSAGYLSVTAQTRPRAVLRWLRAEYKRRVWEWKQGDCLGKQRRQP